MFVCVLWLSRQHESDYAIGSADLSGGDGEGS